MTSDELTVSDLLSLMWERKTWVVGLVLAGAAIGYGITAILPARWESRASLLLPLPESGSSSAASQVTALIGGGSASPLDVLEGVLKSRKATERVAASTGMNPEKLEDALKVQSDSPTNQLIISIEDEDPERGKKVVAEAIKELTILTKNLGISVASRTKTELEAALKVKEGELLNAENRLTNFQKRALTVPDPAMPYSAGAYIKAYNEAKIELGKVTTQLKVARAQAGTQGSAPVELPSGVPERDVWHDKLVEKETQLQLARVHFGEASHEVTTLRQEVQVLRDRIRAEMARKLQAVNTQVDATIAGLEASRQVLTWQTDTLKRLADRAPTEAAEAMRLQREVVTLTEVLAGLRANLEKVRIDADVDRVRWSVLEDPYTVKPAVNKRFMRATAIGAVLGLLAAAFGVFWNFSMKQKRGIA